MIWRSFQIDHGYHIHASEVAETEKRLREARIKEREAVSHESILIQSIHVVMKAN